MTVRFILGSNTTPTSEVVREEIKTMLKQEPYGKPIIFIVPEQMTFQQEYALLEDEIKGSIRAQVLSFSRLAFRVMEETGGATKSMITSMKNGKQIGICFNSQLTRKVLLNN